MNSGFHCSSGRVHASLQSSENLRVYGHLKVTPIVVQSYYYLHHYRCNFSALKLSTQNRYADSTQRSSYRAIASDLSQRVSLWATISGRISAPATCRSRYRELESSSLQTHRLHAADPTRYEWVWQQLTAAPTKPLQKTTACHRSQIRCIRSMPSDTYKQKRAQRLVPLSTAKIVFARTYVCDLIPTIANDLQSLSLQYILTVKRSHWSSRFNFYHYNGIYPRCAYNPDDPQ